MLPMLPHQERVVQEQAELEEKITKLSAFVHTPVFDRLHVDERTRLMLQLRHMRGYSAVLGERIQAFANTP